MKKWILGLASVFANYKGILDSVNNSVFALFDGKTYGGQFFIQFESLEKNC